MSVIEETEVVIDVPTNQELEIPKSHSEIAQAFIPVFDASRILSELLLKHFQNPQDNKNVIMKDILKNLVDLRFFLDEDLKKHMKKHFNNSVYHSVEI